MIAALLLALAAACGGTPRLVSGPTYLAVEWTQGHDVSGQPCRAWGCYVVVSWADGVPLVDWG